MRNHLYVIEETIMSYQTFGSDKGRLMYEDFEAMFKMKTRFKSLQLVKMAEEKPARLMQIAASLSATMGAFSLGTALGWSSPCTKLLKDQGDITDDQVPWVGSSLTLGAAFIMLPLGFVLELLGRKWTMLLLAPPFVLGYILLASFSTSFPVLIVGRVLTGMSGAGFCVAAPLYIGEVADKGLRGMMGVFFQLLLVIGILFTYTAGLIQNVSIISLLCIIGPVVFAGTFFLMPESPLYLLLIDKKERATASLQFFRGKNYNISSELAEMETSATEAKQRRGSLKDVFKSKAALKAFIICVGLMFCQQLSGINAVIFYAGQIFQATGGDEDSQMFPIILGVVQVLATLVAALVVDRIGRRILLIVSHAGMAVCLIAMGWFFIYKKDSGDKAAEVVSWVPLLSLCLYLVFFSLGSGPLPWSMLGEMFPTEIKGPAGSFCAFLNWMLAFAVTSTFQVLTNLLKEGPTFFLYSALCVTSTVFIVFLVVETKGKTLEEVQQELGK